MILPWKIPGMDGHPLYAVVKPRKTREQTLIATYGPSLAAAMEVVPIRGSSGPLETLLCPGADWRAPTLLGKGRSPSLFLHLVRLYKDASSLPQANARVALRIRSALPTAVPLLLQGRTRTDRLSFFIHLIKPVSTPVLIDFN